MDAEELGRQLEESQLETSRLRERLRLNEREINARDAERSLLRITLDRHENEISDRRMELDELKDRFDVQDQALHNARSQFEQERSRNTESQELLAQLRRTLGQEASSATSRLTVEAVTANIAPRSRSMAEREMADVSPSLLRGDSKTPDAEMHQYRPVREAQAIRCPLPRSRQALLHTPPDL
jgi:chromosome segregation ATPase